MGGVYHPRLCSKVIFGKARERRDVCVWYGAIAGPQLAVFSLLNVYVHLLDFKMYGIYSAQAKCTVCNAMSTNVKKNSG